MVEDRHVTLRGGLPERTQARVREREQRVVGQADGQPERLEDLEATRSGLDRHLKLTGQAIAEVGVLDQPPVGVRQRHEAARPRPVVAIQVHLKDVAPSAVEVEDRAQVDRVHQVDERADVGYGPASGRGIALLGGPSAQAEVVVGVDRREAGAVGRVVRRHQRWDGQEVGEGEGLVGGRGGMVDLRALSVDQDDEVSDEVGVSSSSGPLRRFVDVDAGHGQVADRRESRDRSSCAARVGQNTGQERRRTPSHEWATVRSRLNGRRYSSVGATCGCPVSASTGYGARRGAPTAGVPQSRHARSLTTP